MPSLFPLSFQQDAQEFYDLITNIEKEKQIWKMFDLSLRYFSFVQVNDLCSSRTGKSIQSSWL